MVFHRKRRSNSPLSTGPRIYIVDDDHYYRDLLALQLPTLLDCIIVGTATTAAEAVDPIHDLKPDIVILDFLLEDHRADGLTVCQTLCKLRPEVKYILLTSYDRRSIAREALHRCPQIRGMYVKQGDFARSIAEAIPIIAAGSECYDHRFQKHMADAMRYELDFQLTENEKRLIVALGETKALDAAALSLGTTANEASWLFSTLKRKLDLDNAVSIEAFIIHARCIGLLSA